MGSLTSAHSPPLGQDATILAKAGAREGCCSRLSHSCSRGLLSNASDEAQQEALTLPQEENKVLQLSALCQAYSSSSEDYGEERIIPHPRAEVGCLSHEQGKLSAPLTMAEGLVCLSRSRLISLSMDSRMASLQARWQISVRSAPEKPLVILARKSRSTS